MVALSAGARGSSAPRWKRASPQVGDAGQTYAPGFVDASSALACRAQRADRHVKRSAARSEEEERWCDGSRRRPAAAPSHGRQQWRRRCSFPQKEQHDSRAVDARGRRCLQAGSSAAADHAFRVVGDRAEAMASERPVDPRSDRAVQSVAAGTRTNVSVSVTEGSSAVQVMASERPDFSPSTWTSVLPSGNVSVRVATR